MRRRKSERGKGSSFVCLETVSSRLMLPALPIQVGIHRPWSQTSTRPASCLLNIGRLHVVFRPSFDHPSAIRFYSLHYQQLAQHSIATSRALYVGSNEFGRAVVTAEANGQPRLCGNLITTTLAPTIFPSLTKEPTSLIGSYVYSCTTLKHPACAVDPGAMRR